MNKVDQMWYLLLICHDFATVVIPFFRAVQEGNTHESIFPLTFSCLIVDHQDRQTTPENDQVVNEVNMVIMLNMILLKIPPDVIGVGKKYREAIR